ncbi:hypothetical protein H7X69_03265 [Candidatus Saccharibacteria bacterium]|nr:hypothetical protein [Candidatus Saccharibacteria bacterium]
MTASFKHTKQSGQVSGLLISTIGLSILSVVAIAGAIWGYMNYTEQKTNVDGKIEVAVITAKKEQADSDEIKYMKLENALNLQFVGPDDYGRLTFSYPKIWSVYINKEVALGGTYEAYLNPVIVPPVSATQQFGLRVLIESKSYETIIASYSGLVKKGDLRSSAVSVDGNNGTRLDGSFTKDIRGSAVIYKIRDKTVTLRTDADTFKPVFNDIIATVKFNQ